MRERGPWGVSQIHTKKSSTPFMSSHNINPFFPHRHTPPSPPAVIIHPQVPFGLPASPSEGSNHFLLQLHSDVALLLYYALSWISPDCSLLASLGILFYHQAPGQEIHLHRISHARFSRSFVFCSSFLPGSGKGICWGSSLSSCEPVKCFIDYPVVRTFFAH